jgi:flagellar motor protein MotB
MSLRNVSMAMALAIPIFAQPVPPPRNPSQPIYRVTIVQRTTPAINYSHRSEPTKIDFRGTALLPQAHGDATVENRRGATLVDAHFSNVPPPTRFGAQYLTYVVWAISPDGRSQSVGELIPNGSDKGHLFASTPMQAFALIVTAEPYFSVSQPSDVVVMENAIRPETVGEVQQVNATYELMPRKEYTYSITPASPRGEPEGPTVSMQEYEAVVASYQAQNAIQIARAAGADRYAPERLSRAESIFDQAKVLPRKTLGEQVVAKMREAAQIAEDARAISAKRSDEERLAQQQAQTAAAAKEAVQERAAVEAAQLRVREEADRAREEAARASAAEQARQQLEADNAARIAREREQAAAQSADRMRTAPPDNLLETRRSTRALLRQRLRAAFETLDSPRGLVVVVPNGQLENGSGMENTRKRIAMVAYELKAYPGLRIEVDGNTDGGTPEAARRLTLDLANRVRDMLVMEGISPSSINLQGYGSTRPLASNASPGGREQNRRVEIVVAGDAIGNMANWDRTYDLKPR